MVYPNKLISVITGNIHVIIIPINPCNPKNSVAMVENSNEALRSLLCFRKYES